MTENNNLPVHTHIHTASYKTWNENGETETKRNKRNRKPHPKYWFCWPCCML